MKRPSRIADDCFVHDRDRLRHAEVLAILSERLRPVAGTETVSLPKALGRIAAEPVLAMRDVPLHDNSAVDGFAFRHREGDLDLAVGPTVAAGDLTPVSLDPDWAARIFTGAIMPAGTDTVAMQEDCILSEDGRSVRIPAGLRKGANRRLVGEDLRKGEAVVEPGRQLRPQELAALASIGLETVPVFESVRIAILSTGNELLRVGGNRSIEAGQVFDSNSVMLSALCKTVPARCTDLGILPDDPETLRQTLLKAADEHDVILTTGGASRGAEDHVIRTLDRLGKRHLWQIAIKPGRPMTFGQIGNCVFVGLPGNPVAAFVCFLLYCRPAVFLLGGGRHVEPRRFPVPADFLVERKKPDRREFLRGWLAQDDRGNLVVRKFERDGSGLISSLRQAEGLIELAEETRSVSPGDLVSFIPFSEFGL